MGRCCASQFVCLFLILGIGVPSLATTYIVPWDVKNAADLLAFPVGKTFYVGDVLEFQYTPYVNAVFNVNEEGYLLCDPARGTALGITGDTLFTLPRTGLFFFISFTTDCALGEKLLVEVSGGP